VRRRRLGAPVIGRPPGRAPQLSPRDLLASYLLVYGPAREAELVRVFVERRKRLTAEQVREAIADLRTTRRLAEAEDGAPRCRGVVA
jgi:hypothetical protein